MMRTLSPEEFYQGVLDWRAAQLRYLLAEIELKRSERAVRLLEKEIDWLQSHPPMRLGQ